MLWSCEIYLDLLRNKIVLAGLAQLGGELSHRPKCRGYDSQSEHPPRLRVCSPVGECTRGNWSVSVSHWCFSPSLFLPSSSLIPISISFGEDLKNRIKLRSSRNDLGTAQLADEGGLDTFSRSLRALFCGRFPVQWWPNQWLTDSEKLFYFQHLSRTEAGGQTWKSRC